jgi:hypothetical protein
LGRGDRRLPRRSSCMSLSPITPATRTTRAMQWT